MKTWTMAVALAMLGASGGGATQAAEITILANQGALSAIRDIAPAFAAKTGHKVVVAFKQGAAMNRAINENEPGDVVSSFFEASNDLIKRGKVVPGTWAEYARAGNGVAVKAGARKWDISTAEGFKRAMLEANSIGHSNAGTGPYNTRLFQRLGIYDQVKGKIKISEGRPVAAYVASGEVEVGIQQTNVIQPFAGTEYLGPLPPDLIEYGRFGLGVLTVSKEQDVARAFIAFASSPEAAPLVRKSAMEPPAR